MIQSSNGALICDCCQFGADPKTSASRTRRFAARDGWRVATWADRRDFCPMCVQNACWKRWPGMVGE